jgi:hypothetical protein
VVRRVLLGDCLVIDGHAENKRTGTEEERKAGPCSDYSII